MNQRERRLWLIVTPFLFIAILSFVPDYHEYCKIDPETHQKQCATHQIAAFLAIHVGEALNYWGAAVTALATVFIAGFTWTLKRSTDKLWASADRQRRDDEMARNEDAGRFSRTIKIAEDGAEAALKSARAAERALTELERPYVFVDAVESNAAESISEVLAEPPILTVKITIKNFGRTPAVIETLGADIRLSGDDGVLVVSDAEDLILAFGEPHTFECKYDGAYGHEVAGQVRSGRLSILLALSISYRDIFGIAHETGTEWKWWSFNQFHPESSGPRYHTVT